VLRPATRRAALSSGPLLPGGGLPYNQIDRFARYVIVMITNECPVMCAHCVAHSGGVLRGDSPLAVVERTLRGAAAIEGLEAALFSGGEPFAALDLLRDSLRLAKELGLGRSVLTSSHWAISDEETQRTLAPFAGLIDGLYLSVDVDHQRVVPLDHVRRAARAAAKLGIEAFVLNTLAANELAAGATHSRDALEVSREFDLPIHSWPIVGAGRGAQLGRRIPRMGAGESCGILSKPVVYPSGEVHACYAGAGEFGPGHPLRFGNVAEEDLDSIVARISSSRFAQAVRAFGPEGVLELLGESRAGHDTQCGACRRLHVLPRLAERLDAAFARDPGLARRVAAHRRACGDARPDTVLAPAAPKK
jgi:MoaA/NifB/PqqE/SkfB family radical SAM enzyme